MKKFLFALLLVIIGVVAGFYAETYIPAVGLNSEAPESGEDRADSLWVISIIQEYTNPYFSKVDDAIKYRRRCEYEWEVDSMFNNIDEPTLAQVTEVLINRIGITNKYDIVREYSSNRHIYDNLPVPDRPTTELKPDVPLTAPTDNAVNSRDKPTETVSFSQKDTVINGKTYKYKKKEEVTYE